MTQTVAPPSSPVNVTANEARVKPSCNLEAGGNSRMCALIRFLLIVLLLGSTNQLAPAQQYPVQASVQLLPPYSVYLSDYANDRLVVLLQLRDLSKGEIPVRLRWQIRGNGLALETTTAYRPPAHSLAAGLPLRLDGYELADYLRPEHLRGSGLSPSWRREAQLPEGLYTFCVQVLDDITGAVVSNPACASAWLLRHDPPLLNLPENEAHPEARNPQQLTFQWTPRHTGRPNTNFQTEYDFRLVEIWPDEPGAASRNPNDAMQSSVPLYENTTLSTMLVYGPAEPPLVPGRRYAWQVRARSLVNGESWEMFNHQGYSEVRSFRWGDACLNITEVQAEALTGGRLRLRWEAPPTHTNFQVRYRPQGTTRWYSQESFQPETVLTQLESNTTYEYQVGGYCGSIAAELSTVASAPTLEEVVPDYACGLPVPTSDPGSTAPLPTLKVGEVIRAGDFPVTVIQSSGGNGQFSGTGTVALPWLRESVARVSFTDVQINESYQLTAGQLIVNGVALDVVPEEWTEPLADVYEVVDQAGSGLAQSDEILSTAEKVISTASEDGKETPAEATPPPPSSDSETGPTTTEASPPRGGPAPVADGSGSNVNVADGSPGNLAKGTAPSSAPKVQDPVDVPVQFQPNANQAYGFDRKEHDVLTADYPQTLVGGKPYSIAWKSVASGRTDYVNAVADEAESFPAAVRFRTATGQPVVTQPAPDEAEQSLVVVGTTHQAVDELTAYVTKSDDAGNDTETTVGQLNVVSYDELRPKLVIVPVNEAAPPNADALSRELNRIYAQAVAHWEVVIDDPFVVAAEEVPGPDEGRSGLLASFPARMRQFNRSFKRSRDIDRGAYYLFLVPQSGSSRTGFMPFKQQFGYIFTQQTGELSKTIAHELGHGAFRLRHPFDEFGLAQGSTDNLMDYSQGTRLYKYQWDNVHDPEAMVGWLQDDEESAAQDQRILIEMILGEIKASCAKGDTRLDLAKYGVGAYRSKSVRLVNDNEPPCELVVVTKLTNNKNVVNPQKYGNNEMSYAMGRDGSFVRFELFTGTVRTVEVIVEEQYAETLETYLFGEKKKDVLKLAIAAMEVYLGKEYQQESGKLRYEDSEEALEKMDCSELVSRYLAEATGKAIPIYTTSTLQSLFPVGSDYVEYVQGSRSFGFKDIRPGDIFIWRTDRGGHTGVVISYNEESDNVTVIEAIGSSGSADESLSQNLDNYCKGCVRQSMYSRIGGALADHAGWIGYFRPKK